MRGQQIQDNTIEKDKLNLVTPTLPKDPVTKDHFDLNVNRKLSSGTLSDFQNWFDTNLESFNLTDKEKAGLFVYDSTNNTSTTNPMVLVKNNKRYVRQYKGVVSVKWWGIKNDGTTNNTTSFNSLLTWANNRELAIEFEEGVYLFNDTVKFNRISGTTYKSTLFGKGKGTTTLQAGSSLLNKNFIEYLPQSGDSFDRNNSYVEIRDMSINAPYANKVLSMNKVIDVRIYNCNFSGGITNQIEIGDNSGDNYFCTITGCYFNSTTYNGGHSDTLLKVSSNYAEIDTCKFDGARIAIHTNMEGVNISYCHIEGSKFAAIYGESAGGGNCNITNNAIRPYGGYEPNGLFNGTMHGIYIKGISSGASYNTIANNNIFIPIIDNKVITLTNIVGTFLTTPTSSQNRIVGGTSGATAQVIGYNAVNFRLVLNDVIGTFQINENITQIGNTVTAKVGAFIDNHTYALSLITSHQNVVANNIFRGNPEWCVYSTGNNNGLSNNKLETSFNGVYSSGIIEITGGIIFAGGIAFKDLTNGVSKWYNVTYTGTLDGVAVQMFSQLTTTVRNALSVKYPGLTIWNTTTNQLNTWNGTEWIILDPSNPTGKIITSNAVDTEPGINGLTLSNGESVRWEIGKAENQGISNAGQNLYIRRYSNTGVNIGDAVVINRATGLTTFENTLKLPTIQQFADNTAAIAGNVCQNCLYVDNSGAIKIRL